MSLASVVRFGGRSLRPSAEEPDHQRYEGANEKEDEDEGEASALGMAESHAFKAGFTMVLGRYDNTSRRVGNEAFTALNGIPTGVTYFGTPVLSVNGTAIPFPYDIVNLPDGTRIQISANVADTLLTDTSASVIKIAWPFYDPTKWATSVSYSPTDAQFTVARVSDTSFVLFLGPEFFSQHRGQAHAQRRRADGRSARAHDEVIAFLDHGGAVDTEDQIEQSAGIHVGGAAVGIQDDAAFHRGIEDVVDL